MERVIVKGLMNLSGDLKGDYFPLQGSMSYAAKPGGMDSEKEVFGRRDGATRHLKCQLLLVFCVRLEESHWV